MRPFECKLEGLDDRELLLLRRKGGSSSEMRIDDPNPLKRDHSFGVSALSPFEYGPEVFIDPKLLRIVGGSRWRSSAISMEELPEGEEAAADEKA